RAAKRVVVAKAALRPRATRFSPFHGGLGPRRPLHERTPMGGAGPRPSREFAISCAGYRHGAVMRGRFGPHTACVERELARVKMMAWLWPDAEMEALTPAAQRWLEERADEHFGVLAPFLPPGTNLPTRLLVTRSMKEACYRPLRKPTPEEV